ncbi:unnamed protein product [Rotaria sp. Silwood1]|nr:unnamed protein product [Rotaria sp. Silwood1]
MGDLNGDTYLDVVAPGSFANYFTVLLGDGTGAFFASLSVVTDNYPMSVAVYDFDNNGGLDVVVAHAWGHLLVFMNAF